MKNKLGQESAFPHDEYGYINEDMPCNLIESHNGMSKRFYAACAAMQGLLANADWTKSANIPDDFDEYKERIANASYEFADELLKQENNE